MNKVVKNQNKVVSKIREDKKLSQKLKLYFLEALFRTTLYHSCRK